MLRKAIEVEFKFGARIVLIASYRIGIASAQSGKGGEVPASTKHPHSSQPFSLVDGISPCIPAAAGRNPLLKQLAPKFSSSFPSPFFSFLQIKKQRRRHDRHLVFFFGKKKSQCRLPYFESSGDENHPR